jgi:hypothetical protein
MSDRTLLVLRGFTDADVVERIVDSSLVDVAYIEGISTSEILVKADPTVPLMSPDDYEWLRSVVEEALHQYGESNIIVEWKESA